MVDIALRGVRRELGILVRPKHLDMEPQRPPMTAHGSRRRALVYGSAD
jgi:hypothetical protein